jgi:uncharacterized protein (TIRG00374 family)
MAPGRVHRSVRTVTLLLLAAFVVVHFVLPEIAGARQALHVIGDVNPLWLLAGTAAELSSVVAYAQLTRALLPAPGRPSLWRTLQITVTTLGVSHLVPGGSAAGLSLGYRLWTDAGAESDDVTFALGSQSLGSAVVLNVILWLALLASIPVRGFNPVYATAAVIGAVLFALVGAAVLLATKGKDRLVDVVCSVLKPVRVVNVDAVAKLLRGVADRLRVVAADRDLLRRALFWAVVNWLLDAAALGIFIAAFHGWVGLDALLISFGIANVLAAIPITPGGLGVVEAGLSAMLVGFGLPRATAVVAVVAYRLAQFWLPIPLAGYGYVALRVERGRRRRMARQELHEVAEAAVEKAATVRDWAERVGLGRGGSRDD